MNVYTHTEIIYSVFQFILFGAICGVIYKVIETLMSVVFVGLRLFTDSISTAKLPLGRRYYEKYCFISPDLPIALREILNAVFLLCAAPTYAVWSYITSDGAFRLYNLFFCVAFFLLTLKYVSLPLSLLCKAFRIVIYTLIFPFAYIFNKFSILCSFGNEK